MKVTAKNPGFNGKVGKDVFVDGVCANASESQRSYYLRHSYTIDEAAESTPGVKPGAKAKLPAWQEYAKSIGLDPSGMTLAAIKEAVAALEAEDQDETTEESTDSE